MVKRDTVEYTPRLDITNIQALDRNTWYSFKFGAGIKTKGILYEDQFQIGDQVINFNSTKTGYGIRKWFVCSCCGKNFKRLYMPITSDLWACRYYHELTYLKSQLSGNEFEYLTLQIRELQLELGVSKENNWPVYGNVNIEIEWLPMFKPKNMHWSTFNKKRNQLELMIIKRADLWMALAG